MHLKALEMCTWNKIALRIELMCGSQVFCLSVEGKHVSQVKILRVLLELCPPLQNHYFLLKYD